MPESHPSHRQEIALYWAAVSLIVCEGLALEKAAERLGLDTDQLRRILEQREAMCPRAAGDELSH